MTNPADPAWLPDTEGELHTALTGGLLDENHHLELKRQIPEGRGENRETARDLASLAVDGGRIIVGIDEGDPEQGRAASLSPVPLHGLAERLEQVALTRIDPPLQPRTHSVSAEGEQHGFGYLLIDVPASPQAPHMVDGRYWGRGDKTKHELSDGEVERIMRRRHAWEANIHQLLDDQEARDPTDPAERGGPHMFMVACPVAPRDDALAELFADQRFGERLYGVLRNRPQRPRLRGSRIPIDDVMKHPHRRAEGGALCHRLTAPRQPERDPQGGVKKDVFELELSENGMLRLFTNIVDQPDKALPETPIVLEHVVLGLAHHVLACCLTVAEEAGHYLNQDLAVSFTGMYGAVGAHSLGLANKGVPFTQAFYRRTTRATPMELARRPGAAVERLLGPLMRSFDTAHASEVAALLSDPGLGDDTNDES